MEFRLVYQGPLPSGNAGGRVAEKHAIRRQIHPQLRQLWNVNQRLHTTQLNLHTTGTRLIRPLGGYEFVPLVSNYFNVVCALDIIFLRREEPGNLIQGGGDIDNRLKVLFDALRIPQTLGELGAAAPTPDEVPHFYSLLEDDKLITEVKVTTDTLLTPLVVGHDQHDVHLLIHVRTIALHGPTL